jgi:translocation and assembly module TamB
MNWKKASRWIGVVLLSLLFALFVVGYFFVHSRMFNQFVLSQAEQQTHARTGARLNISSVAIDWSHLAVDLYALTLHGAESRIQPPLLAMEHLRIRLKIVSLLRSKVDLAEIVIDRPEAHIFLDAQGHSNLPETPPASSSSSFPETIFNLAVQHVSINDGQIYYNDEKIPLAAELRDFRAESSFNNLSSEYRGSLSYNNARIAAKNFNPVEHDLRLQFAANRSSLTINSLTLAVGKSHVSAQGKLANYDRPSVEANYEGVVITSELAHILKEPSLPEGEVALTGKFRYQNIPGEKNFLDSASLEGVASSRGFLVRIGQASIPTQGIRAVYRLHDGDLNVRNIEAQLLGGHLSGNYELRDVSRAPASRFDAAIRNVSLDAIDLAAVAQNREAVRLSGRADVTAQASWSSSVQDALVRARAEIHGPNQPAAGSSTIPLNGLVDVTYEGARNAASFGQSYLQTGTTRVAVSGILSKQSQLSVQANTNDLNEVAVLVCALGGRSGSAKGTPSPLPLDLHGSARFSGHVLGEAKNPRIGGEFFANDFDVRDVHWRALHTSIDAGSSGVALSDGSLQGAQQEKINFSARIGLSSWSFTSASLISLQASAGQVSIADLQRLAQTNYPVDGTLTAGISVHGSEQNLIGSGSLRVLHASAWNEQVASFTADFKSDGNAIHSNAQLQIPAGRLAATLSFVPKTQEYEATLNSSGLQFDQLRAVQRRDLGISGIAALAAKGRGTVKDPQLAVNFQIPKLQVRDQVISQVQAALSVAHERVEFSLDSRADQGFIRANGGVNLTGDYPASASLDVRALPVAIVLARYLPRNQNLRGETEIHASLNGPLKDLKRVVAHVEVPKLDIAYNSVQLGLVSPLRVDYREGVAKCERTELKGTKTDLTLQGTIPMKSTVALNVSGNGTVDLSLLRDFVPSVQSNGHVDFNVSARGDFSHPMMEGQIHIVNAALSTETTPIGLEGVNGEFQISGDRVEIKQFSGTAGGGNVAARGFMTYGKQPAFDLGLEAKTVRVRYPEGIRSILSGNLSLKGTAADSQLTGRVLIDRLSFTQQFDLANFLGQFSTETPGTTASPLEENMKLNVAVSSAQDLNLASSKISIAGAANLRLSGTMADPVVLGRTNLTSGEVFFLGKRYEIQNGAIEFANPLRTTPVVNLYVKTTVQQYNITLSFVGSIDHLQTNYTSDPPLPSSDIINLVAFGQTTEQAATSPGTPATVGAESVLAQGAAGQVSGQIEKLTGISQLTIDPLASNSQANPGAQVAIQQRVTGNILLTFSTDVTSTQNQAVQVEYKVKKDLSVSALRDEYGGYAIDVRIHKRF